MSELSQRGLLGIATVELLGITGGVVRSGPRLRSVMVMSATVVRSTI